VDARRRFVRVVHSDRNALIDVSVPCQVRQETWCSNVTHDILFDQPWASAYRRRGRVFTSACLKISTLSLRNIGRMHAASLSAGSVSSLAPRSLWHRHPPSSSLESHHRHNVGLRGGGRSRLKTREQALTRAIFYLTTTRAACQTPPRGCHDGQRLRDTEIQRFAINGSCSQSQTSQPSTSTFALQQFVISSSPKQGI